MKFIKVRGRVIPIRNPAPGPSDMQKIVHVQKARAFAKSTTMDALSGSFWKTARSQSREVGKMAAKRIARFKLKGIK